MKTSKGRGLRDASRATEPTQIAQDTPTADDAPSLPMLVAEIFKKLRLAQRARVLRRLLLPVGPMALAVLGGGAFVKFVTEARWPRMSIPLEVAARVTPAQVFELARYVEQSDPHALQRLLMRLARDATTAAAGISIAAVVVRNIAKREGMHGQFA